MIKKSLEEKIKDVVFWTIAFFILYTIVGFLLETNWLKTAITLPEVNVILKDSLTITAAFLAPVAAFVLFSDWRLQHREIAIEANSSRILSLINKLYWEMHILKLEITNPKKKEPSDLQEILAKIESCRIKNGALVVEFSEFCHIATTNLDFANLSDEIINVDFPDFLLDVATHYSLLKKIANPQNYLSKQELHISLEEYSNKLKEELNNIQSKMEMDFSEINKKLIELSILNDELKV